MGDCVGLHHTILAERSCCARQKLYPVLTASSAVPLHITESVWALSLEEFEPNRVPPARKWVHEEYFSEDSEISWKHAVKTFSKDDLTTMPVMLSFQDGFNLKDGSAPAHDCYREKFFTSFFPKPSASEDPERRPDRCQNVK